MGTPIVGTRSESTAGTLSSLRVPAADRTTALPFAVVATAIVALGLADGGFDPAGWWTATFAFATVGIAAVVLDGRRSLDNWSLLTVVALGLLTAWTALSASWAPDDVPALLDARRDVLYLVALVVLLAVGQRAPRALAVGAFVGTTALIATALTLFLLPIGERVASPFEGYLLFRPIGYANATGIVAAVGILLSLLASPGTVRPAIRGACAACVVMCAATLCLTGSRGAVLALILGLAIAIALAPSRPALLRAAVALAPGALLASALCMVVDVRGPYPEFQRAHSIALAIALVGAALGAALLTPVLDVFLDRRPTTLGRAALGGCALLVAVLGIVLLATRIGALADTRLEYWRVALDMARDHPLLGGGSGSFAAYWQASGADRGAHDAHGVFTEAAGELGLPGVLLVSLTLLVPIAAGLRARRTHWLAVTVGAYCATVFHAALDWDRELPVVVLVGSALGAVLLIARNEA